MIVKCPKCGSTSITTQKEPYVILTKKEKWFLGISILILGIFAQFGLHYIFILL